MDEGLPQLQEDAKVWISTHDKRSGRIPPNIIAEDYVTFSISAQKGELWETAASINLARWALYDYGDRLHWGNVTNELMEDLNSTDVEKNQCLIIHLAAGIYFRNLRSFGLERKGEEFPSIAYLPAEIRPDMYQNAKECHDSIGELGTEAPLLMAELRSHARDLCKRNHDKDNRILLRFPPKSMNGFNVCIVNGFPSLRYTTRNYTWELDAPDQWNYLLSYKNHMRLPIPPSTEAENELLSKPTSVSFLKGWANLLISEVNQYPVTLKTLSRCPTCQERGVRLPIGAQGAMAGKASIKGSRQLGPLLIQEPWTSEFASYISMQALDVWLAEHNSPDLDEPRRFQRGPNLKSENS